MLGGPGSAGVGRVAAPRAGNPDRCGEGIARAIEVDGEGIGHGNGGPRLRVQ